MGVSVEDEDHAEFNAIAIGRATFDINHGVAVDLLCASQAAKSRSLSARLESDFDLD
jgi:hypothetical protein